MNDWQLKRLSLSFVGALVLFMAFTMNIEIHGQEKTSVQADSKSKVGELLNNLDSPKFELRQQATKELTSRGKYSLLPMAEHYLDASPEAAWRIKKSLEEIGVRGDEEIFLKSVGMLQVLVGTNSTKMNDQLERLKFEWQQSRTKEAIKVLRAAGATIDDVGEPSFRATTNKKTPATKKEIVGRAARMSTTEKLSTLKKIVEGSIDENRKRVLGSDDDVSIASDKESDEMLNALERQFANRVIVRGGRPVNLANRPGVIVKIGNTWKGNKAEFEQMQNIRNLNQIVLQNQFVDRSKLEALSSLQKVRSLEFDSCRFSGTAMATVGLPKSINDIRFRNQDIEVSMIDRISKLPIRSLVFESCDFSTASLKKMLAMKTVTYLELINQSLDVSDMKRLKSQQNLASLKLGGTKFPFQAYKDLTKARPDLYVDFKTTAFLGVRSVQGLNDSCRISDVISGSGAEAGGIQVDDVITHVDGFEIGKFNDLRAHIALHQPNESLKVTVSRLGQTKELTIKLGDIDQAPNQ